MLNQLKNSKVKPVFEVLAVAILYVVLGRIGLQSGEPLRFTTVTVWPTAGLAVAYLTLRGVKWWPAIFLGSFFIALHIYFRWLPNWLGLTVPHIFFFSFWIAVCMALQASVQSYVIRRFIGINRVFSSSSNVLNFICVVVLVCAVGTALGALKEPLTGVGLWSDYGRRWVQWWIGNVIGVLMIAPVVLLWAERRLGTIFRRERLPSVLIHTAAILVASQLFFGVPFDVRVDHGERLYMIVPLLFWVIFRGELAEGITALFLTSLLAIWATAAGHGPFVSIEPGGNLFGVQVFIGVITSVGLLFGAALVERKRTEAERGELLAKEKRLGQELAQSNEQLSRFAHVASHDLTEPLRMVTLYLALLEKKNGTILDKESQEFLHYAVDGASRMKQLLESLIRYSESATQAILRQPVEMANVVRNCVADLQSVIRESEAVLHVPSLPSIQGDPVLLAQLVQNFVANALKYRSDRVRPEIDIAANRVENEWVFSVRDNGIGFDMKHSTRIFEPFQRLHSRPRISGAGLGLSICKSIVERHGGRIWASSVVGVGSTFFFSIPDPKMAPVLSFKRA